MSSYSTIDYIPDLTTSQMLNAGKLTFAPYTPSSGTSTADYEATVVGSGNPSYTTSHGIYRIDAIAGATYDIVSISFLDPDSLTIYDKYGNAIVTNSEYDYEPEIASDGTYYSIDAEYGWVAPYTGTFYIDASWDVGYYYDKYGLGVLEDVDTSLNKVNGTISSDNLLGTRGKDQIKGLAGNDTIDGGSAADTMIGGMGNDIYHVRQTSDKVTEYTNEGTDTVLSYTTSYTLPANVENGRIMSVGSANLNGNELNNYLIAGIGNNIINGGAGGDLINYSYATAGVKINLGTSTSQVTGGSGSDTLISIEHIVGSNYNDVLTGNSVYNKISGEAGNDKINGGTGNDVLSGGAGNDKINGGTGNDVLSGGAGKDIFRFSSSIVSTNADKITDFIVVDDSIELENSIFTKLSTTGTLSSANFTANTSGRALDSNDYIVYETDTGNLYYDMDGIGANTPVLITTITNTPTITNLDIFVT